MNFTRKRGFTLVEMLIIVFLLSVGLSGIILAMTHGMSFVQKTRQKVIAVNLAREGIEQVYNIRDTNRNLWAGQKEACWLKVNPFDTSPGDGDACQDDPWFGQGNYILVNSDSA